MDCARIASKLREQMVQFSGELSVDFPKVLRRFMTEMIYGIQARRVFGIPDFRLYALADGIKHFLFSQSKGLKLALPLPKPHFVQKLLFDI